MLIKYLRNLFVQNIPNFENCHRIDIVFLKTIPKLFFIFLLKSIDRQLKTLIKETINSFPILHKSCDGAKKTRSSHR
jgi:hypothetical protein